MPRACAVVSTFLCFVNQDEVALAKFGKLTTPSRPWLGKCFAVMRPFRAARVK
jgi:hypothetical protein